ncbi:hypothetical protein KVR01_005742 [Diaporthe batatas]|uniref:uncharacterized protein n=1 Tax=Diaporthe batatas TaxID=748121 RepID=UPI001D054F41|nr:uncharacterized protein KVR01_005742 [Diaporthe batatas]KAG8163824.1 hypothetical protein KVR01_005742 [Diaporthe batatas]
MSQKAVIAGIIIGVVFLLLFVASVIAYCLQKRRSRKQKHSDEEHALQRVFGPQTEQEVRAATRTLTMNDKIERREFH